MLQVCLFVPFLNEETPRPQTIPKSELKFEYLKPEPTLLASILSLRQNILLAHGNKKGPAPNSMMQNIPEMASQREDEEEDTPNGKGKGHDKLSEAGSKIYSYQTMNEVMFQSASNPQTFKAHSEFD